MKPDFYDRSKRTNIYNSIYILKILSLILLLVLTVLMTIFYYRDKAAYDVIAGGSTPLVFRIMTACILLFVAVIIGDFYILSKTASIGRHLNKLAFIDKLTGLPNRYSCDLLVESFNSPDRLPNAGFILLRINNLGEINADNGHANGNNLISEFCSILEDVSENYGYVGRNGGNEYIVLMENCDNTNIEMFLMDLTKRIHGYNELNVGYPLEIAYSKCLNCDEHLEKMSELISCGYQKIREMPLILA